MMERNEKQQNETQDAKKRYQEKNTKTKLKHDETKNNYKEITR